MSGKLNWIGNCYKPHAMIENRGPFDSDFLEINQVDGMVYGDPVPKSLIEFGIVGIYKKG